MPSSANTFWKSEKCKVFGIGNHAVAIKMSAFNTGQPPSREQDPRNANGPGQGRRVVPTSGGRLNGGWKSFVHPVPGKEKVF
jgi:hypothetical protein